MTQIFKLTFFKNLMYPAVLQRALGVRVLPFESHCCKSISNPLTVALCSGATDYDVMLIY